MTVTRLLASVLLFALPVSAQVGVLVQQGVFGQQMGRPGPPPVSGLKPGTVEGTVKNLVTGAPVKRAMVMLQGSRGASYSTAADGFGHFLFDRVEPGMTYMVIAEHEGYTFSLPSPRGADGNRPIAVAEDAHIKGVEVRLAPMGAISGKVVNDDRDPVVRASVQVLQYDYSRSVKRLFPRGNAITDDRGEYRIFDIPPGRYYILATGPVDFIAPSGPRVHSTAPDEGLLPTYFPDGSDPSQATPVDLKPGADLGGQDFRLHKIRLFHIRGKAFDAQTKQPIRGGVQVARCGNDFLGSGGGPAMTMMPDGSFDARGVVPGSYCLVARENFQGRLSYASQPVTVTNRDIDGIVLQAEAGFDIKGSVIVEGPPPPNGQAFHIMLQGIDVTMAVPNAATKPDGAFVLQNVFPGTYEFVMQGMPASLYLKSVRFGGQDASDGVLRVAAGGAPLTVVIGGDPGHVTGTVQSSDGQPASAMIVAAPPYGPLATRGDLVKMVSSGQTGQFSLQGLAPGDYKVFAFEEPDMSIRQNLELRKLLESKAASVTIHGGETGNVQLKTISAADVEEAKGKLN